MVKPGPRNSICDVPGLRVGQAEDRVVRTGVTVIVAEPAAVMAVDVRGGAPGTRETDALDPTCLVDRCHALVLSGGSAFGLDAAGAVAARLSARGVGLPLSPRAVPVVPAAILYDLGNGGNKDWGDDPPYRRLGFAALDAAAETFALGNAGAGFGATAGGLKGGLGSASAILDDGTAVGALVAVNCFGSVVSPSGGFWAGYLEQNHEFGGLGRRGLGDVALDVDLPKTPILGANTTIGLVATDAALTKAEAKRLAVMAQDGLARAIRPIHTPYDGDSIFAAATGRRDLQDPRPLALTRIGAIAADCLARAVVRGVLAAESLGALTCYGDAFRR